MFEDVVKYRDWTFSVNKTRTRLVYDGVIQSGADSCKCEYCLNYTMNRENIFPEEVFRLFNQLGIDFRKEVEVTQWETFNNGNIHIGGWFHFIGDILKGELYKIPLPNGGHTFKLTKIADNFSIGFDYGNNLTFFDPNEKLVQIEFDTVIPWTLKKEFNTKTRTNIIGTGSFFKSTFRKLLKIVVGLLLLLAVAVGLYSINHPIILKWMTGSARQIGKPIQATVYINGQVNKGVKVFHVDKYWGSNEKANNYLLNIPEFDTLGILKYFNINLNEKWIGSPVGTSKNDYDLIAGHLFQSETGGHFSPFQDDMKGFKFDPQLSFTDIQIKFNMPPNKLKFDSIRIELQ